MNNSPSGKFLKKSPYKLALLRPQTTASSEPPGQSRENLTRKKIQTKKPLTAGQINEQSPSPQATENILVMSSEPVTSPINNFDQPFTEAQIIEQPLISLAVENMIPVYPKREESSESSETEKIKSSPGTSKSESEDGGDGEDGEDDEDDEAPKKKKNKNLLLIRNASDKSEEEEEEKSPDQYDEGNSPLNKNEDSDIERDNDEKSPASADLLIRKQILQATNLTIEADQEKGESGLKRSMTRKNPEIELATVKPPQNPKSRKIHLEPLTPTPATSVGSQITGFLKFGGLSIFGEKRGSETPKVNGDGNGDGDESSDASTPTSVRAKSTKRIGTVFKDKSSKSTFGLNYKEDPEIEKAKKAQKEKLMSKENRAKINLAVWRRRTGRFIFLALYIVLAIGIGALAFLNLIKRGKYTNFTHTNLSFTLDNCTFLIQDHEDTSVDSPVYFKYQAPKSSGAQKLDILEPDSAGADYRIIVENKFDISYCRLSLFVKPNTALDSLSFNCGTCDIIQDTSFQLQVTGDMYISGDSKVNANFKDIKVNKFTYNATSGYLQLSNIEAASDSNVIELYGEGDIILQSVNEFQVNITTYTEAFCLNGPFVEAPENGTCTIIDDSGDSSNTTDTLETDGTCQVIYNLGTSANSAPTTKFTVTAKYDSSVFANVIPGVGSPVTQWEDSELIKGGAYTNGYGFTKSASQAVDDFDSLISDSSKGNPFVILDLGNFNSRSARFMRWILSSTPSYSLMRPWWIGTLSATVLNGYKEKITGYVFPGFCPYTPQYTIANHYDIYNILDAYINSSNTLFTFVKDNGVDPPPTDPLATSGLYNYSQSRNPFDEWLSFATSDNTNVVLQNNSFSDKPTILASIIASLLIAVLISYLVLILVMGGVNLMYTKLMNFTSHLQNYSRLENRKEDYDHEANSMPVKKKSNQNSLKQFLEDSPSPVAFLDYMIMLIYRQYTNSVTQFYQSLFRPINPSQDQELDPNRDMLKGTEAKILYEKFCFLKNISEQKLTDKKNLNILKSFGFEIITRGDAPCEVFTNIKIKNRENFLSSTPKEEKVDSLKIYMDENIEKTEFDEDQVEIEDFIQSYYRFCDHNRFPRVIIYPSLMKERFDINHAAIPQQFITRIQQEEEDFFGDWIPTKALGLNKLGNTLGLNKLNKLLKPAININAKYYIIDTVRLQNHLALVMDKVSELSESDLSEATIDLILFKGHIVWDAISVLIHIIGTAFVPIPVMAFVVLSDSQYEPWSVKKPETLVWMSDILRDPATLIQNIYLNFTWNTVIMIITTVLTLLSFIDLLLSYGVMEFPQDKTFRKSHLKSENAIQRLSRQIQWGIVLLILFLYFTYIGLVLTWLLLGAFINPNAFLPFASAAITFVTFFITKYNAFKKLVKEGSEIISKHLKAFMDESVKKVMGKFIEGAEKVAGSVTEKGKGLLESDAFNGATNQLVDIGIMDPSLVEEYKKQIQDLNSQAILQGGIAGIQDKNILISKMDEITNSLKKKGVERVIEGCRRKKLPEPIIELIIGLLIKDNDHVRKAVFDIIQLFVKEKKMPEETIEIICDLLFPEGGEKNSMARSISSKIMNMISKNLDLEAKIPEFNSNTLLLALMDFQNLEEFDYESFLNGLRQLTKNTNHSSAISNLGPALTLISALSQERPKYWKTKEPALELMKSSVNLVTESQEIMDDFSSTTFESFADFISLLSASFGEQSLEPQYMLRIISNFCGATGINKAFYDKAQISGEFIPSLIYLTLSYTRPETYKLSKEAIQNLAEAFKLSELGNNDFLPFCFELASTIYYDSEQSEDRFLKCIENFDLNPKLGEFAKIVAFYSVEGHESHDRHKGVDKNSYFIRMAQKVEMQPQELLGLIDLLYGKHNSQSTRSFLEAIMKRMDIKKEKLKKLEPVINLFMSDDEAVVLDAVKALNLALKRFLLIGKGILNPKFMPAKNFEEIGVKNTLIIHSKDTVYDPDNEDEQWLRWKEQLKDDLTHSSLGATREGFVNKNIDHYIANLVSFYMSDWDRFEYSPKSIANFLTLIDPEKTLVDSDKGSMTRYINFLSVVLPLTTLRLKKKTRCEKLGRDQETAIKKIADCLNIKLDPLKTCLQMFIVNEQDVISNCFSFFFQDKLTDTDALDRVLAYSFQQVDIMNDKVEFLTKKLPKAISLIDNDMASFPGSVIKKLFFGGSKESLRTSDILELSSFIISKLDKSVSEKDQLLAICYKLGLFSKSLLTIEDIVEVFHIKDQGIVNLFRILTESDSETRIARIIDTFPDDTNPLKFSMALYAVLEGHNPMVKNTTRAGFLRRNKQSAEKEYATTYLSEMCKVEPEIFDLFKIVFERNETLFIQKAMPLLRRITKTSLIDTNLMESLLSLSLGHRFNTGYLANRLRIPSDTLDFFISLLGLSNKQRRKEELAILSKSTAAKNVLKKLGIELPELVAIIRLVFNMFNDEDNDENQVLLKTITDLGFKTVESSTSADNETVEMERFEGFMTLSLPINPKLKDKKRIANLKTLKNQTNGFFSAFSLTPDDAFLISRITIGDFLAIQQYPERLDWAFPLQDQPAASAIMNLTMGICGLLNPHVDIKIDFDKQVSAFMREETDQKPSQDSLPNNTLGYATYLTYSTLDIAPFWTQVFMFDREAYSKLENNIPEIKPDFVITIVTNFIEMSEAARDILAFYEWNKAYRAFMDENGLECGKFVTYIEEYVWRFFGDRFNFDYNETKSRINHSKTSLGNLGKKFVKSQKKYTYNINNTLWALLSSKCPSLQSTIDEHLRKPTSEFLVEIAKSYKGRKKFSKQKQEKVAVGEVVKLAIELCYTYIAINLTGKDTKIQGYQLTDLCMLGTIVGLRDSAGQKIPYERQLYNLHQLAANIERKLFLEDQYYKMSKFKLMKLVGISLGMQVSNIVEWCLPPSLFTNEHVTALERSKEESQRLNIKLKFCQKLDMQFESNRRDILIGDLGKFAGSGFDYVNLLEGMLKTNGWESINTLLALSEKYLGDPNADAKKADQQIKKLMNANILLRKSKVDVYEESLYLPLELLVQKHTSNDLQQTALGRHQSRKSDYNDVQLISDEKDSKKTETLKDAKTSLPYSVLEQRYRDFERTLTHANMGLIQGVINGDPSVMLRGNHDIVRSDPEKKAKAKLYMALIGLQSFQKGDRTDRKRLEEYLHPISQKMQSEKSKIRSLLLFFITGNPELKEIISSLELNQDVVDLLFVSLKKHAQNDENDSEEAPLFDSFKSLLKASEIEIEAFQLIKNIYQFDLNDGWMPLIEILSKVGITDLAHHPLTLLFEMIDFDKLKESSTSHFSHSGQGLMSFMKPKPSEIADTILMISNKVCKKTRVDDETFAKVFQALQSIAKQDFPHLFKMLILSNNNKKSGDSPSKSTLGKLFTVKIYEPESLLENLLYLVGVDTRSAQAIKDMKIVRMFLTMANGDFKSIKKSPDYKDIMNGIIDTILESQLFASHSIDKSIQRSLTQLLLGALSWDLEIIMGGLINTSTLEEAYFIYNLFGCLNLSKIYQGQAEGNDSGLQIKKHLEVMLSAVIQNIAPKYETSDLNVIGRLINQDLGSVSSENQCIVLAERMENMLKLVQDFNSRKDDRPSFLQSIDNTLSIPALNSSLAQFLSNSEEDAEKDLNINLVEILTSVCDGTLLTGLINGFIKDEDLKNFLNEVIQFIVKLILTLQEKKVEHKEPLFTHFKSLIQAINKLKPHEAWDAVIEVVPKFMQLYVNIQGQPELNQIITEMLRSIKHLLTVSGSEQQALLMDDVFSVVVGNDISTFDFNDTTIELKPKFNTSVGEKTQIIFTKITPKVFPSLGNHITGDQLEGLYRIVVKLQTDFIENIRIPTNLHDVAFDIAQELESFGYCEADFIDYIREVLRGRISYISYLLGKVAPNSPPEAREELRGYLLQCESLFNAMPNNRSLKLGFKPNDASAKKASQKDWGALMQKIKEGSGPGLVKELFQLVDQEGDGSGKISIEEFYALASRLGLKLSQHRITEIFAKVKKIKPSKDGNQELDEKEFEKALSYLEEKNLYQAMEMLGITPENLGVIFVILILLLLLIFVFIFLGIKAFTIGGTFGAVINSSFPAIGGLSLGKKSDSSKEKLEDENVENAAETAYNINASEDL